MNAMEYLRIAPLFNDCPNCGNDKVGGGEGGLNVDDNTFKRSCKCGFVIEYDVTKGAHSKKKIKEFIADELKKFNKE